MDRSINNSRSNAHLSRTVSIGDGGGLGDDGESGKSAILWGTKLSKSMLHFPDNIADNMDQVPTDDAAMMEEFDLQTLETDPAANPTSHTSSMNSASSSYPTNMNSFVFQIPTVKLENNPTLHHQQQFYHPQQLGHIQASSNTHSFSPPTLVPAVTQNNNNALPQNLTASPQLRNQQQSFHIPPGGIQSTSNITNALTSNGTVALIAHHQPTTISSQMSVEEAKKFERVHWKIVPATRKSNTLLWKYFKVYDESHHVTDTIVCTMCYEKKKDLLGAYPKQWEVKIGDSKSTSHLVLHLKHNHKIEYEEYMQADRERKVKQGKLTAVPVNKSSMGNGGFKGVHAGSGANPIHGYASMEVADSEDTGSAGEGSGTGNNEIVGLDSNSNNTVISTVIKEPTSSLGADATITTAGKTPQQEMAYYLTAASIPNTEEKYMKAYLRWVILDHLPLDTCNKPHYQVMMKTLSRRDISIDRTTLLNLLDSETKAAKDTLRDMISNSYIALTIDNWTAEDSTQYLIVAITLITNDWENNTFRLFCGPHYQHHHRLHDIVKGLIQEYNINPRKISAIISKKAVNFASATIGSSNYRGDDDGHTNKAVTNITVGLTKHAKEINFVCFEAEIDYFIEKILSHLNAYSLIRKLEAYLPGASMESTSRNDRNHYMFESIHYIISNYEECFSDRGTHTRTCSDEITSGNSIATNNIPLVSVQDHLLLQQIVKISQPFIHARKHFINKTFFSLSCIPIYLMNLKEAMSITLHEYREQLALEGSGHCPVDLLQTLLIPLCEDIVKDLDVKWKLDFSQGVEEDYWKATGLPEKAFLATALDPRVHVLSKIWNHSVSLKVWSKIKQLLGEVYDEKSRGTAGNNVQNLHIGSNTIGGRGGWVATPSTCGEFTNSSLISSTLAVPVLDVEPDGGRSTIGLNLSHHFPPVAPAFVPAGEGNSIAGLGNASNLRKHDLNDVYSSNGSTTNQVFHDTMFNNNSGTSSGSNAAGPAIAKSKHDLIEDEIGLFQILKEDYQKKFSEEGGNIGSLPVSPDGPVTGVSYFPGSPSALAVVTDEVSGSSSADGHDNGTGHVSKKLAFSSPNRVSVSGLGESKIEQSNPLEWWKLHEIKLPLMSSLAKRLFCIPATARPWRFKASVFANFALVPEQLQNTLLLYDVWRRILTDPKRINYASSSQAVVGTTSKVKSRYSLAQDK